MKTYIFRCPECGATAEAKDRKAVPLCTGSSEHRTDLPMQRDYKAEAVGTDLRGLRASIHGVRRSK